MVAIASELFGIITKAKDIFGVRDCSGFGRGVPKQH